MLPTAPILLAAGLLMAGEASDAPRFLPNPSEQCWEGELLPQTFPPRVRFLLNLLLGTANLNGMAEALGEPVDSPMFGRVGYLRYPRYGIEVVIDERDRVVGVRPIPAKFPPGAPAPVKHDMEKLQGYWQHLATESGGTTEQVPYGYRTVFVFDGDRLIMCGGGIAIGLFYRLDPSTHTMHFFLPDPKDDAAWFREVMKARQVRYRFRGEHLELQFPEKGRPDFVGSKKDAAALLHLKRVPTGDPMEGWIGPP